IETGAAYFKSLADNVLTDKNAKADKDTLLAKLYYSQAQSLYGRLAAGDVDNIRLERVPFSYDWLNWIDNKLGRRNFQEQYFREKAAVDIFDQLVQSPDSVYPEQLYKAAYGNRLLGGILDSMGIYNTANIAVLKKEIGLRERVTAIDLYNEANWKYLYGNYQKLSYLYDTVAW